MTTTTGPSASASVPNYAISNGIVYAEERLHRWGFQYNHDELTQRIGIAMEAYVGEPPQVVEYFTEMLALSISIGSISIGPQMGAMGPEEVLQNIFETLRDIIFDHIGR